MGFRNSPRVLNIMILHYHNVFLSFKADALASCLNELKANSYKVNEKNIIKDKIYAILERVIMEITNKNLLDQYGSVKMVNPIMKYFEYKHLPEKLGEVSSKFYDVANWIEGFIPDSAEKSAGLRKLLEAKDCIVRASLDKVS